MARILLVLASISVCALSALGAAQQGIGQEIYQPGSVQTLEEGLSAYLNGEEIKSVLTPGEFVEWKLKLKPGQVVIAEARSDSFDPALQIVNEQNKVLAFNDDRYPGDQRPLLLWTCERAGTYAIHVRSFHDKFGGEFFLRFKTYDSVTVAPGKAAEIGGIGESPFLLRIPMKAGQIKEIVSTSPGARNYQRFYVQQFIAPDGLPALNLSQAFQSVSVNTMLLAPVGGEYFALCAARGYDPRRMVCASTREVIPRPLTRKNGIESGMGRTNLPAVWELTVKRGQLIEVSTPGLNLDCGLVVAEAPNLSRYDVTKDGANPFFPLTGPPPDNGPLAIQLPARRRDNRISVFSVSRNAKLWLASNGAGPPNAQYAIRVRPAAAPFPESKTTTGRLKVGNTDYWSFEANAGDVMSFHASTRDFDQVVTLRDPEMAELRHVEALPDQTSDEWRMVVQKPGRYLEALSSLGDGGGGAYSISRRVIHPREFGLSNPARSEISAGAIQVWKFTATPKVPLLIHWGSANWSYDVAIYDEKGNSADFQREDVDPHNKFGILKVSKPQTFVIVLTANQKKASYSIELSPIPGYGKGS
jgi:hypothetical protein